MGAAIGNYVEAARLLTEGSRVTAEELKQPVHDRLARFKTPRDVEFLDELPRNGTGKVLKRELRAL